MKRDSEARIPFVSAVSEGRAHWSCLRVTPCPFQLHSTPVPFLEASFLPDLLKLVTSSFMQRGADISFLSAFPAENEVVYPPMTFVQPFGDARDIEGVTVVDAHVTVG